MRNKFLTRELSAFNSNKLKTPLFEERGNSKDEIRDSLKNLTECIMQMTQEIKEMKNNKLRGETSMQKN